MLSALLLAAAAVVPASAQEPATARALDTEQDPAVAAGGAARCAAARGVGLAPPDRLAQHFLFFGKTSFIVGGGEPVTQECEVGLGGPDRLRYLLRAGLQKNVFLLEASETAWVRGGDAEYGRYPARELAVQTWLRWIACRFPWDSVDPLEEAPPDLRELRFRSALGECSLELDDDLLPRRLVHAEVTLELDDWAAQRDGRRMPATWTWTVGDVRQIERFDKIELDVLYFDRAFAPPRQAPRELRWTGVVTDPVKGGKLGSDSIAVVQRPALRLLRGPAAGAWHSSLVEAGVAAPVLWEWLDARGAASAAACAVIGPLPPRLPEGLTVVEQPAGLYLRWLSYAAEVDVATSAASLRDGARKGRLEAAGPVWRRRPPADGSPHRNELLLPVRQP